MIFKVWYEVGTMDLVLVIKIKYYLLDYKSNFLGEYQRITIKTTGH